MFCGLVLEGLRRRAKAETRTLKNPVTTREQAAMMQPRDAHHDDDGDCAMEEAGSRVANSSSSPATTTATTADGAPLVRDDASSTSLAGQVTQSQRTAAASPSPAPTLSATGVACNDAAAALVGARKRKAVRVVKHQVSLLFFFLFVSLLSV